MYSLYWIITCFYVSYTAAWETLQSSKALSFSSQHLPTILTSFTLPASGEVQVCINIILWYVCTSLKTWCTSTSFFFFFSCQSGKIRLKFQYVIASVSPNGITGRWLAAPPASCRGGEGRDRLSGALYVRLCAPLRDQGRNAPARREEKHQRRRARDRQTDTQQRLGHLPRSRSLQRYSSRCAQRIHTDSILHFIPSAAAAAERSGGKKKVWRNAVSVPAPDQPAVCLQQPAPSPADGGLLVRSDAPARRLLQLRHRYVHGSHRPIYCHKRLCFISLFSILLSLFLWEHVGIRVDTRGRTDLQSVHSVHSSSRYTSWSWDVWGHFSSNFYAFSQVSTPEHHIKALSTM